MARGGVTFTEVDETARYLQGLGKNPTVDSIRAQLGTGSRTTLAEHLKRWKSLQTNGKGRLPEPLLALVTGLWDGVEALAEQKIEENQSIAHEELVALRSQLQAVQQTENKLAQEHHQLQETLDAEQRTKSVLTTQLQTLQTAHDKLNALHQSVTQQRDDAKEENQRLHKLATQIQANLEHYQQAVQQQQQELHLAKEKQYATYAQELSQLKKLLDDANLHCAQSEKSLAASQYEQQQLLQKYDHQSLQYEKLVDKHQNVEHQLIHLQAVTNAQQKQIEKIEPELLSSQQLTQSLNQQIAVLNSQLERTQTDLKQAEDKIETLRHEKMFLAQEKLNFEVALKILQNKDAVLSNT